MVGDTRQFLDSRARKAQNRQSRSCKVCRLRKVKCDRVKPCHACCAHGYPSKCVYDTVPDDEARPISQAEEIRNLRSEIRDLRSRIDERECGDGVQDLQRLDRLESLFDSLRSAPIQTVDDLVRDIRSAHVGLKKDLVPVGPWEGTEAYESYPSPNSAVLPTRTRLLLNSPVEDFNNIPGEDDDSLEIMSVGSGSGSDSSGTISIMSMQRPAVDIFVERFVDAFSPEVDVKSGRAGALRAAAGIRMFSPLITDAFEAVSVAFFGRSVQNKEIEASGFRLYPRVLRGLQDALVDPEKCNAESTLVTVILLLAFESVERTTQSGVSAHVRGAVRLIEHRGPENHMYGVEHLLFTELRPYWIGGALAARQPSFLAREEWKTIPWSAGTTKKDFLHHLLDLAAEVPGYLALSDAFKDAQKNSVMGAQEMAVKQSTIWNGIGELTNKFYQWYEDWVVTYPDGPPQEVEQMGDQGFPIFQRRNLRTGATFTPPRFEYPNLLMAQTMCLYYSFRLVLSSVDSRPHDRVSPMEQYDLGCGICRSLEFYILTAPGNMINRLAFPTRVAWEAFPDGGPERQFMIEVLHLVEKRHALGLWGSAMPELSTRESSPLNSGSP
ncbi:unnamed protein product [Penicillium salamii]|uniref:Zn(2)-C6 fungal-type domain-containing protein n=1 Tax=Penicillium salamii TaxID=1612424 RepID=A0A9W4NQY0_9EURO|nr:unnamed protein product [Penicillium salamii]CAG8141143.1 unnamed protein product [Penicillium salamii]CAG8155152.1 unnamed protein product [Penicillium salamii]CAG8158083.1 unnamed protein product [Penicillium salamii]CAG8160212.1 unnamed protein product [Penicillium salamii]